MRKRIVSVLFITLLLLNLFTVLPVSVSAGSMRIPARRSQTGLLSVKKAGAIPQR